MSPSPTRPTALSTTDTLMLTAVFAGVTGSLVSWAGAALTAVLSGHPLPQVNPVTGILALAEHSGNPGAAWGQPVGPTWLYWTSTASVIVALAVAGAAGWRVSTRNKTARTHDPRRIQGLASKAEVAKVAGSKALIAQAGGLRPSLARPQVTDLGHRLGRARGVDCYASVEDSMVLLGPPRSGKGVHVVINAILDAPGAVITTSTRPDNLTAALQARAKVGPVAVFDPQRLAPGIPSATRWSPIRGCENPQTAMVRARALTAGAASGTTDSTFWQSSAEQAVRALLHAAALGDRSSADLYRWSLSAAQAREAVMILATHPGAALSWHQGLEAIVGADQKQRDSVWAMVAIAFAALADPAVLDAVSPGPGEQFDPQTFLRHRGTVFLVGTSTGASATAGLVGAFVEDVAEAARRLAAASPGARIDPPLSMILDEAANYPLPSLTSLMSEGGGTGITTMVVLQSLAQARAVWGEHEASAIWDAASVKLILGGGSNARDLEDLSKLIGQREERQYTESIGADGRRSSSSSSREVPVMDTSRLRMLPFGTAVLMLRAARPIVLTMTPWTRRPEAAQLQGSRRQLEGVIERASSPAFEPLVS
ncbi:MAG TPA: TraM recognition domain-containing protein [Dermatophilaceae bacterium]